MNAGVPLPTTTTPRVRHEDSCGPRHVAAAVCSAFPLVRENVACGAHRRTRICFSHPVTAPNCGDGKGGRAMSATKTMLLAAMMWAATTSLQAQEAVSKTNVLKMGGTIAAIDATNRTLTLRDDKGTEDTFSVGPAVQRFNELKVGQKVNITYYESL